MGFPVRTEPFKGTHDAIAALTMLHDRYPTSTRFCAFGPPAAMVLPPWIEFQAAPTDARLSRFFNSISIFVLPSHYEGWGLPGLEALACGAALVTTDSLGIRGYARDGENALVAPRQQPMALAAAVVRLIQDDDLRRRLARQGSADAQHFSWNRSVELLEQVLQRAVQPDL